MDADRARDVLGVEPGDDWSTVRDRYRRRIQQVHPDRVGRRAEAAAELNAAYATLRRVQRGGESPTPPAAEPDGSRPMPVATDAATLYLDDPPAVALGRILTGLELIGEVAGVDRSSLAAEAIVVLEDGTSHSLVLTLRPRGAGTEAVATLEALQTVARGDPSAVVRTLARFIPPRGGTSAG